MRGLGCLVVAVLVLGIALFFGDQAVTNVAERATAREVSQSLDADTTVDFTGWPVALRMLQGRIPTATVNIKDMPLEQGGRLDTLDIVLRDVRVNISDVTSGGDGRLPPARKGTFEAELGEPSVAEAMNLPDAVTLTLDNQLATLSAAGLKVQAEVAARDGDIIVSLAGPLQRILGGAEFPIDLSDEVGAPAVRDVQIDDGVLLLRGDLEEVER